MRYLAVKNYEKYQHYKEPDPVWIKFHVAVLWDTAITRLPEAAQCQLFKLWLLASRHGNRIPYDVKHIRDELRPRGRLYLSELLEAGLLYITYSESRESLDGIEPPYAGADARSTREGRGESSSSSSSPGARETNKPNGKDQLLAELVPTRRRGMAAAIAMWESGSDLPPGSGIPTPEQIHAACRDVLASCELGNLTPKVLRGFLVRAMRPADDVRPIRAYGRNGRPEATPPPRGNSPPPADPDVKCQHCGTKETHDVNGRLVPKHKPDCRVHALVSSVGGAA